MAGRAGWGAGPASAGATGPSRLFLGASLLGSLVVTGVFAADGRIASAAVGAAVSVYFAWKVVGYGRGRG